MVVEEESFSNRDHPWPVRCWYRRTLDRIAIILGCIKNDDYEAQANQPEPCFSCKKQRVYIILKPDEKREGHMQWLNP